MAGTMGRSSFEKMISEDLEWLTNCTQDSLERRHIIECLEHMTSLQYDERPVRALTHWQTENGVSDQSEYGKQVAFLRSVIEEGEPGYGDMGPNGEQEVLWYAHGRWFSECPNLSKYLSESEKADRPRVEG